MTTAEMVGLILDVAEQALIAAGRPVGRRTIVAGVAPWDECCEGALWAGVSRRYRSVAFPIEDATYRPCDAAPYVNEIVVGLLRCVPTLGATGQPPAEEEITEASSVFYDDADVVWAALAAWVCDAPTEAMVLGQSYVGAEGGCIGVETRLVVAEV
jgi:hypothetical protein